MKTISQAPLPLRHLTIKQLTQPHIIIPCQTCTRFFASAAAPPRQASSRFVGQKKQKDTIRRFIPEEAKKFVKPDGKLHTTRETRDFFVEHNLEPDNGAARRLTTGPAIQSISKAYNATTAFSPRHIIHPYDLRFFDPRGHPLAAARRAMYLRKSLEQPLWVMITSAGAASVVRTLTQRRLKSAIFRSLEELGFRNSVGGNKEIRGTLWITLHDPVKASKLPPEPFGEVIAKALQSRCSQPLR
ncbi:hypothetical protein ACHAQJ_003444 [Trichoderma viride]